MPLNISNFQLVFRGFSPDILQQFAELETVIARKHRKLKESGLDLGEPIGEELVGPRGGDHRVQEYQHGAIVWLRGYKPHEIHGAIYARWKAILPDPLQRPVPMNDETALADGTGRFNLFGYADWYRRLVTAGRIVWSQATGAQQIGTGAGAIWDSLGREQGLLGYPQTEMVRPPRWNKNARHIEIQRFQRGVIFFYHAPGDSDLVGKQWISAVYGPIWQKLQALGGEIALGAAFTGVHATSDGIGQYCHFEELDDVGIPFKLSVYSSPATGAHVVAGAIRQKWMEMGAETSTLGYPITDEMPWSGAVDGRISKFQRGEIRWSRSGGVWVVTSGGGGSTAPATVTQLFKLSAFADGPTEDTAWYSGSYPGPFATLTTGEITKVSVQKNSGQTVVLLKPGRTLEEVDQVEATIIVDESRPLVGDNLAIFTGKPAKSITLRALANSSEARELILWIDHTI